MIDYREELDCKMGLLFYLVKHFGINTKNKNILTIEKLKLLFLLACNPKLLNSVSLKLIGKGIRSVKSSLYDESSSISDLKYRDETSIIIAYMCKENFLQVVNKDDVNFIEISTKTDELPEVIDSSAPKHLSTNINLIKRLINKSEPQLIKAILEN